MINREDMLALTRRMTVKRTSMTRIAGGYIDLEGYIKVESCGAWKEFTDCEESTICTDESKLARIQNFAGKNARRQCMEAFNGIKGMWIEKWCINGDILRDCGRTL